MPVFDMQPQQSARQSMSGYAKPNPSRSYAEYSAKPGNRPGYTQPMKPGNTGMAKPMPAQPAPTKHRLYNQYTQPIQPPVSMRPEAFSQFSQPIGSGFIPMPSGNSLADLLTRQQIQPTFNRTPLI